MIRPFLYMNLCPQIQVPDLKAVKLSQDISKTEAKEECGHFRNAKWEALVQQAEVKTVLRKAIKIQKGWRLAGGRPVLLEVRSRELRMSASRRLRQRTDWNKAQKGETENIKDNI